MEHKKDRDDSQILKQEDGEAGTTGGGVQSFLLRQHLDDDGGGGHCQRQADDNRADRPVTQQHRGPGKDPAAKNELKEPEAENQPAHYDQPLEGQLQTDHKEQQHDTEVRDRLDGSRFADADCRNPRQSRSQRGEPERTHDNAYEHEAEHRTDAQAVK
jgi:hypothetical protein